MKLEPLDWVVITAVTVVLICLAQRFFSGHDFPPAEE